MLEKLMDRKWHPYTTIDRNPCNEGQRVGYCWNEIHRGYLTKNLMKEHQCIEKKCRHFQKYENSPYWKEKEARREKKKKRKEILKKNENDKNRILNKIREITIEDENFHAISVEKDKNIYVVRYIRFDFVNTASYVKMFKEIFGCNFYLKEIKTNYEKKKEILKNINKK
jgi:hypothetical protein